MSGDGSRGLIEPDAVSNLAHALRSPLAIIVGYAELLRRRDDPALRAEAPEHILEAANRLTVCVDDLLLMLAADARSLYLDRAPVSLSAAVAEAVATVVSRAGPECTFELRGADVELEADEEHLQRILEQLLANAARRAPAGSVVAVEIRSNDAVGEITVTDAGRPIGADDVPRVFDRFRPMSDEGARLTGLELYGVRLLVELHGGSVGVRSDPGATVFSAKLPLR